jgi:hypothetical protein
MKCRYCQTELEYVFLDLGFAPPSNAYLSREDLRAPEVTYPLKIFVCNKCWLVQTEDYTEAKKLFSRDYAYFSSTSKSWLEHSSQYAKMISEHLNLNEKSFVVEIASNDGYLLKNFVGNKIPCLGIEPTESTANEAERIGVPVLREFFSENIALSLLKEGKSADLICGNNVYAHVPNIKEFTKGLKILLKKDGLINLEFPHLMRLIENNQFDTVYHEHFSYLSLTFVSRIFFETGLRLYDVEELKTHGGSLRIYGCHIDDPRPTKVSISNLLKKEEMFGLKNINTYLNFQEKANRVKNIFLEFLLKEKLEGKTIAAYGAAAKGNTLLNFAGIKNDLIGFVCDAAYSKQNKFLPGSHIPILPPTELINKKPDWVIIFPWNIADEIIIQQKEIYSWGGKFVIAVPELRVFQ